DLMSDSTGSDRLLLELEDANAFVVSLDPQREWFRYHQLLKDFLRLDLCRRYPTRSRISTGAPLRGFKSMERSLKLCATRKVLGTGPAPRNYSLTTSWA